MLFAMTVKDRQGQEISLGLVSNLEISLPIDANLGKAQAQALEVSCYRALSQNQDDAADDILFRLQAGDGHGEVEPTEVKVQFMHPQTRVEIGELKMQASVQSYGDADVGAAIRSHVVLRASSYEYQPARGQGVIVQKTTN